jgi:hypothetical protein
MKSRESFTGLGLRVAARLLLGVAALVAAGQVRADWAGFARFGAVAEVAVEERAVRVHLRLLDKALPGLARLVVPAEPDASPERIAARLLVLRDGAGRVLPGRLAAPRGAETSPAKAGQGAAAPEPYREAELVFSLPKRAEVLAIEPPAGVGEEDIGLIALHRGVPASDLVPLDKPSALRLDWSDPWQSRFDAAAMARYHAEPRSFIYVEPYEVRHEILIRVRDLLPRLDFRPVNSGRIESTERAALQQAIGAYLAGHNPLRIDGAPLPPELDRVEFVRFDRLGVRVLGEAEPLDSATALAGVILVYLTDRPARSIELAWESFGKDESRRPVTVQYGIESHESYATRRDPVFRWTSDEVFGVPETDQSAAAPAEPESPVPRVPRALAMGLRYAGAAIAVAALAGTVRNRRTRHSGRVAEVCLLLALAGCVGFYPEIARVPDAVAGPLEPLPEEAARAELHALLHNVYRAFQIRGEEAAYDRLALSLDGDILEEVYLRQRQALRQRSQGLGGEGRVNRIEILDSRIAQGTSRTLRIDARWVAHGTVSHWGHSHERSNEYRANFVLSPSLEGRWKITGLEFLDTRRRAEAGSSL